MAISHLLLALDLGYLEPGDFTNRESPKEMQSEKNMPVETSCVVLTFSNKNLFNDFTPSGCQAIF